MEQNNKQPVQENKNPIPPTNPPKKEESIQAGKERMETDGGTHCKNNDPQNTSVDQKKYDADAVSEKNLNKPGFQTSVKKPDLSSNQVKW